MSSTGRGAVRADHDYYKTNVADIALFLREWVANDKQAAKLLATPGCRILDPCAGGNIAPVDWEYKPAKNGKPAEIIHVPESPMSYPTALRNVCGDGPIIETIDIREDSPADDHGNFLDLCYAHDDQRPDLIISNPPFSLAIEFIRHSLKVVRPGGFVVMLLRLNFFGSAKRKPFFDKFMPMAHYIHHERMGFTPDGKADSVEYSHLVWNEGFYLGYSIGRVI